MILSLKDRQSGADVLKTKNKKLPDIFYPVFSQKLSVIRVEYFQRIMLPASIYRSIRPNFNIGNVFFFLSSPLSCAIGIYSIQFPVSAAAGNISNTVFIPSHFIRKRLSGPVSCKPPFFLTLFIKPVSLPDQAAVSAELPYRGKA